MIHRARTPESAKAVRLCPESPRGQLTMNAWPAHLLIFPARKATDSRKQRNGLSNCPTPLTAESSRGHPNWKLEATKFCELNEYNTYLTWCTMKCSSILAT